MLPEECVIEGEFGVGLICKPAMLVTQFQAENSLSTHLFQPRPATYGRQPDPVGVEVQHGRENLSPPVDF